MWMSCPYCDYKWEFYSWEELKKYDCCPCCLICFDQNPTQQEIDEAKVRADDVRKIYDYAEKFAMASISGEMVECKITKEEFDIMVKEFKIRDEAYRKKHGRSDKVNRP